MPKAETLPAGERPIGEATLTDPTGRHPPLRVQVSVSRNQILLRPAGYGEPDAADGAGAPVILDLFAGRLRLVVFADLDDPEPRTIPLDGAREARRRPDRHAS